MMSYQIKTYQEGFIENQFEIGSAIYDAWPMGGQTRPDQLRKTYSANDFDPETRFYALEDQEMVGFLTASYKEERDGKQVFFFEFPYVKQEHAPVAEQVLIEHAIAALKKKGADVLLARAGDYWGKSKQYAEKYGFAKTQDIARRGEIMVNKINPDRLDENSAILDFDHDHHFNGNVQLYHKVMGGDIGQIRTNLERWENFKEGQQVKSPWDHTLTLLGHFVAVVDDEVVGRAVTMNHDNFGDETMNLNQFLIKPGYDNIKSQLLKSLIERGREHGKQVLIVHTGIWGLNPVEEDFFGKFSSGFEMKLAYYEKNLS